MAISRTDGRKIPHRDLRPVRQIRLATRGQVKKACAKVIARERAKRGISQQLLADLAGLDISYISYMERCIKSPSMYVQVNIARSFDLTLSEFSALIEAELPAV